MPDKEPDVVVDPSEDEIVDQPSDVVVDLQKKDEKQVKETPKQESVSPELQ